ncbi:MAG TPA: thioredoxin family protein [Flavobacteriaceae bacterium]|nr:thioredoxin family protein [Flavobacteriaceae bacterium]
MDKIDGFQGFSEMLKDRQMVVFFFSTENCSVCTTLKPKIREMIEIHFPKMEFQTINLNDQPELTSVFGVYTAPTLLVYFEGKEYIRKSQNMGIDEVKEAIERLYKLMDS